MEKWEHKFVVFRPRLSSCIEERSETEVNELLERHGREGWQLVSHAPNDTDNSFNSTSVKSLTFTFKRRL
jgi:hypothetical protein